MQTSQSEPLDRQTCNLLMLRARFKPGTDARGKPVESTYRNSVRWTIPEDAVGELGPGDLVSSFVIGPDGTAQNCQIERTAGKMPYLADLACGPKERVAVPVGKDGKPVSRRFRIHTTIEVEDMPQAQ